MRILLISDPVAQEETKTNQGKDQLVLTSAIFQVDFSSGLKAKN